MLLFSLLILLLLLLLIFLSILLYFLDFLLLKVILESLDLSVATTLPWVLDWSLTLNSLKSNNWALYILIYWRRAIYNSTHRPRDIGPWTTADFFLFYFISNSHILFYIVLSHFTLYRKTKTYKTNCNFIDNFTKV